jgi:hypothetical protein
MADKTDKTEKKTAGAFDVRNIIGLLLTTYGVILTVTGLVGDTGEDKTGGVNANLYAGIALLVAGAFFLVWTRLRPIVVPDEVVRDDVPPPSH